VSQYPEKLSPAMTEHYLSLLLYVCCHREYEARKTGQSAVRKLVAGLGGHTLTMTLLKLLLPLLDQQDWDEVDSAFLIFQF